VKRFIILNSLFCFVIVGFSFIFVFLLQRNQRCIC